MCRGDVKTIEGRSGGMKILGTNNTITFKIGAMRTESPVRMNTTTPVSRCSLRENKITAKHKNKTEIPV